MEAITQNADVEDKTYHMIELFKKYSAKKQIRLIQTLNKT